MPGTLYIVATPIGNLKDITLRALEVLANVELIVAEDTRVTRKLLSHYTIHKQMLSLHAYSPEDRTREIIRRLQEGINVALVADAGTPLLSDPGALLAAEAASTGVRVVPIPGPSAITAALAACGLPITRFAFDGFPPRRKGDRRTFFQRLRSEGRAVVLFEAPGRLVQTLEDLYQALGDRDVAVARELTKVHEEIFRGSLPDAIAHFAASQVRGECTIVVAPPVTQQPPASDEAAALTQLTTKLAEGVTLRSAVDEVSEVFGIPKKKIYAAALNARKARAGGLRREVETGAEGPPVPTVEPCEASHGGSRKK
ncbi:MAG: 16S rRNA (cytidine(1402)-2'-O)-methyltransferase [Chthonomonadales bacterium]